MRDSKAENDKRNWGTGTKAVRKTKKSNSTSFDFTKILIIKSIKDSKDDVHKRFTNVEHKEKKVFVFISTRSGLPG